MLNILKYFKKIKSSAWINDISILSLSAVLAQGLILAATPVLSRIYNPEDYAGLAVFMAVYSIVGVAANLKYDSAIMLPKRDEISRAVFLLSLVITLIVGSSLLLVLFLSSPFIETITSPSYISLLSVACFIGIFFSFYLCSNVMLNRRKEYSRLAKLPIYQNILIVALSITLGFNHSPHGLIVSQAFGVTVAMLMTLYFNKEYLLRGWSLSSMYGVMRKYVASPKYLFPAALVDTFSQYLPLFMILLYFDEHIGGQFGMSWRIMMIPMALIGSSISQVFFQRFSAQIDGSIGRKRELIRTWKFLAFIGLPPLIVLSLFGEEIFIFVLGSNWSEAGILAAFLGPMFYVRLVFGPTSMAFTVLGMQRYVFWYSLAILFLRPLVLVLGFKFVDLYFGIMLLSIFEVLQVILYQRVLWQRISN